MYADKCFVIILPMYYYMHTFYKQGKIFQSIGTKDILGKK